MDTLAHALWNWAILRKSRRFWLVMLVGILPDLLSFGPHLTASLFNGELHAGPPSLSTIPLYVFVTYDLTHSLLIAAAVFGLISLIRDRIPLWLYAWPIHILIDIPTHSFRFFPTPFLWPLSDYRFNGISWGTPWFMITNYTALALVYGWIYLRKHENTKTHRARRRKDKA